jgi:hypothetical protein
MHDWELGPGPSAGIGRSGVAQWRQACASGGEAALAAKPVPGRPRKLTDQQCQRLLPLLGLLPLVCEILLQAVSSRSDRFCQLSRHTGFLGWEVIPSPGV